MGLVSIVVTWDRSPLSKKMELLHGFITKYSMATDDASIFELERDMGDYICLLIPRFLALLGTLLKRNGKYANLITCLSCFLRTSKGIEYTITSSAVLPLCLRALKHDVEEVNADDTVAALRALRSLAMCSDDIRQYLVNLGAMEMACVVLQNSLLPIEVQREGSHFLMDLATLNAQSCAIFNDLIRRLFLSPHLSTKHAAVLMLTYVYESHSVSMYYTDWASELHVELCRLLLCSTLIYQYDTAALVSYLLYENDISPLLLKTCTAVLCLRYIPGGAPLLTPSSSSDFAYPELHNKDNNVFETLEIVVCSALLQCLCRFDIRSRKFAEISRHLRRGRLAKALLAHILWYSRERSVLQRIITLWTPFTNNEAEASPQSKYRKACEVTKKYLARKLRRGGVMPTLVHYQAGDDTSSLKDVVFANVIRLLQDWIERDSIANADLEADLIQHGLKQYIRRKTFAKNATVDVMSTIIAINMNGFSDSAAHHPASELLRHLSGILMPGDLVRYLKMHLQEALSLADDDTCSSITIPEARSLWWDSSKSSMASKGLYSLNDLEEQVCLSTPRTSIREPSVSLVLASRANSVCSPVSDVMPACPESNQVYHPPPQSPTWMHIPHAPFTSPIRASSKPFNRNFKVKVHSGERRAPLEIVIRERSPPQNEVYFDPIMPAPPRHKSGRMKQRAKIFADR